MARSSAMLIALGAPGDGHLSAELEARQRDVELLLQGVQTARTEAIRRNVRTQFVLTDLPISTPICQRPGAGRRTAGTGSSPAAASASWTLLDAKSGAEGEGSAGRAATSGHRQRACARRRSMARSRSTASAGRPERRYRIDITNPAAGVCEPRRPSAVAASPCRPAGTSPRAIRCLAPGDSRACPTELAPSRRQRGFFLIEAMVAMLIFALGILGLVAMGGTAVASQSDAQYRTEASRPCRRDRG